jgi:hypothetical protein
MIIKFWCRGFGDRGEKVFSSWRQAKDELQRLNDTGFTVLRIFAAMDVEEFRGLYQEVPHV